MRQVNAATLALIKRFEGCVLHVYDDGAGYPTIGVGHLIKHNESFTTITMEQADELLQHDLEIAEQAVDTMVHVPLTDNQFGSLVSLVFNIGAGAFAGSTLLKLLNQHSYNDAADRFLQWNHAGGKVMTGLTRRRVAERSLFLTNDLSKDKTQPKQEGGVPQ